MPKYSIIVPVYRVEAYLPACIDSVLAQASATTYELILVDDGSPDNSGRICDEYAAKDPRIRVLHTENHGVSHARNLGIREACGEYLLFLDADDKWEPSLLQTLEPLLVSSPDIANIGYFCLYENGHKSPGIVLPLPNGESGQMYLKKLFSFTKVPCFCSWSYAYRRIFVLENQLLFCEDLKVSEDFDQIMRALSSAKSITGCGDSLYLYRMREGSATASITAKKLMDNLTTKAYWFRKYPNAAMANLYANNALLSAKLSRKDSPEVFTCLQENRDIWHHVTELPLKIGRILVVCFGNHGGALLFSKLRSVLHRFHCK